MARGVVHQVIEELLERDVRLTTRDVAARARVSRQAAQKQLKALVASGVLSVEGKARAATYRRGDAEARALRAKVSDLAELLRERVDVPLRLDDARRVDDSVARRLQAQVDDAAVGAAHPEVDDSLPPPKPTVGDSFRGALRGAPLRVTLAVAEAGSLYRLSARLLLDEVAADEVVFDFNGVMEASDEFLEELFVRWAPQNPQTRVSVVNVPAPLRERLAGWTALPALA